MNWLFYSSVRSKNSIKKITQYHVGFTHKEEFQIKNEKLKKKYPYSIKSVFWTSQNSNWSSSFSQHSGQSCGGPHCCISCPQIIQILFIQGNLLFFLCWEYSYMKFALWSNCSIFMGSIKGKLLRIERDHNNRCDYNRITVISAGLRNKFCVSLCSDELGMEYE